MPRVLLAQDDDKIRKLLSWCLQQEGYSVTECGEEAQLLSHLRSYLLPEEPEWYDLIVSDIRMPSITAPILLDSASETELFPPMILVTAFGDEHVREQAERLGVTAFLDKPFEMEELVGLICDLVPLRVKIDKPKKNEDEE